MRAHRPQPSHLPHCPCRRRSGGASGHDSRQRGGIDCDPRHGERFQWGVGDAGDAGRHNEGTAKRGGGGEMLSEDEEAKEAGPDRLGGVEQRRLRARQPL